MYHPKYALFYDFHTQSACPDVGKEIDANDFIAKAASCGVDFMTFHARCNQGFSYYNTSIGIRHPNLKIDLFGNLAAACKQQHIAFSAYLNGGISNEEGIRNRDWLRLSFDGRQYPEGKETPYVRTMCFNSPYRDHLLGMIREIAEQYQPDGFFLDCFSPQICVCPICARRMQESGYDPLNIEDVRHFGRLSAMSFAREIAETARKFLREPLLYFNGLGYEEQKGIGTYLECECLPTAPSWGYDFLPLAARYIRALGYETALNMTARFRDWGDFGSIRRTSAIQNDLFLGLALGLRPNIGSHLHPQGKWEDRVFRCIREVYSGIQVFEEYFEKNTPLVDAAVLFVKDGIHFSAKKYLKGAVKALSELQIQFDVITPSCDFSKYRLLILPEDVLLPEDTAQKIREFLLAGNRLFACASSGLKRDRSGFALEKELGIRYDGACRLDPGYFLTTCEYSEELASMPRSLPCRGEAVSVLPGTEIAAYMVKPFQKKGWDGLRTSYYNPPAEQTAEPFLVFHENTAYCTHDIFSGYYTNGTSELKEVIASVLNRLLGEPLLKTAGFPDYAMAFLSEQKEKNRLVLHLSACFHEETLPVSGASIQVKTDRKICRVKMKGRDLPFRKKDDYIEIPLADWRGYAPVVLELEETIPSANSGE